MKFLEYLIRKHFLVSSSEQLMNCKSAIKSLPKPNLGVVLGEVESIHKALTKTLLIRCQKFVYLFKVIFAPGKMCIIIYSSQAQTPQYPTTIYIAITIQSRIFVCTSVFLASPFHDPITLLDMEWKVPSSHPKTVYSPITIPSRCNIWSQDTFHHILECVL